MRFVTLIRSVKSSGVSEKRKRRETACSDCESLFNPSFFFLTCFVSCVANANSSFRSILHLFFILLSQPTK